MPIEQTDIARLYEVADDSEAFTLDQLRLRAGLTWDCPRDGATICWTNDETAKTCANCGKVQQATECPCLTEDDPNHALTDGVCYMCSEDRCDFCRWTLEFTLSNARGDLVDIRAALDGSGPRLGDDGYDEMTRTKWNLERWRGESPEAAALAEELIPLHEGYLDTI